MEPIEQFFVCECGDPDHMMVVKVENWNGNDSAPDFLIQIEASQYLPWYRRVVVAIGYIFGDRLSWNDMILNRHAVERLAICIREYRHRHEIVARQGKLDFGKE
jgi:hypothetical protein